MNAEIETTNNEIEMLLPSRPMSSNSVEQLMKHAQAMSAAKQLADAMCATDLVPSDYKGKPGNGAAAMLFGAELGLTPIQSLQQIFVVHGRPAIYARTAVALVKRQGVVIETVESTDVSVTVRGRDTRTGQVEEATWTIERAKQAGYTKNAKYQSNPQEMLWAKAAMEVARRVAPDVLLGIPYSVEDLTVGPPMQVRAERVDMGQRTLNALRDKAALAWQVDRYEHICGVPADVRMASRAQISQLKQIRAAEKYEQDADWFAYLHDVLGLTVTADKQLTEEEAKQVIDLFNGAQESSDG